MARPDPAPPFSPGLFAGLLIRPLPDALLDRALSLTMKQVLQKHPGMFSRLPQTCQGNIIITVTDLRIALTLELALPDARLRVATQEDGQSAVAGISGPLQPLIDLMEGRVDGDALFFSRDLAFEGDTEVVVALRNALDSNDINVVDLLPFPPFLTSLRPKLTGLLADIHLRASRDLEMIRSAATSRLEKNDRRQKARIQELEDRLATLESRAARADARRPGAKQKQPAARGGATT